MTETMIFTLILLSVVGIISSIMFLIFAGTEHFSDYKGYTPETTLRWHLAQLYAANYLFVIVTLCASIKFVLIYLAFGVAWSMLHWIRRTRKVLKIYHNKECTYEEMTKHIDASKFAMYIVTDIFIWPVRMVYGFIMTIREFMNKPNKDWWLLTKPIGAIYTNLGVSKAERVELKMKKD